MRIVLFFVIGSHASMMGRRPVRRSFRCSVLSMLAMSAVFIVRRIGISSGLGKPGKFRRCSRAWNKGGSPIFRGTDHPPVRHCHLHKCDQGSKWQQKPGKGLMGQHGAGVSGEMPLKKGSLDELRWVPNAQGWLWPYRARARVWDVLNGAELGAGTEADKRLSIDQSPMRCLTCRASRQPRSGLVRKAHQSRSQAADLRSVSRRSCSSQPANSDALGGSADA